MALRYLSPLHKAVRQIGLYLAPRMAALGLTNQEGHLLAFLGSYDGRPMGELTRVFGLKPSSATSLVDRLVDRGLVRRELSPTDRRSFLVWLTADGKRTARKVRAIVEELEARLTDAIVPRDHKAFERVMAAIATVTDVEVRPPASSSSKETTR